MVGNLVQKTEIDMGFMWFYMGFMWFYMVYLYTVYVPDVPRMPEEPQRLCGRWTRLRGVYVYVSDR
jgi:hypothetical protein